MRKTFVLLLAAFLLSLPLSKAQEPVSIPYLQGFESLNLPGWILKSGSQILPTAVVDYNGNGIGISAGSPMTGESSLCASSWTCDADFWAISPEFAIHTDLAVLSWYWKTHSYVYSNYDEVDVMLSTSGTDPSSFTTIAHKVFDTPLHEYENMTFDLGQYVDQNVRVAFHFTGHNGSAVYIDNFTIADGSPLVMGVEKPDWAFVNDTVRLKAKMLSHGEYDYYWETDDGIICDEQQDSVVYIYWDESAENGYHTVRVTASLDGAESEYSVDVYVVNCENLGEIQFPYIEDFNKPTCWKSYSLMDSIQWDYQGVGRASSSEPQSDRWLVTPEIDVNLSHPTISFDLELITFTLSDEEMTSSVALYYAYSPSLEVFDTTEWHLIDVVDEDMIGMYKTLLPEDVIGETVTFAIRHLANVTGEYASSSVRISHFVIDEAAAPEIKSIRVPRHISQEVVQHISAEVESLLPVTYEWVFEGADPETSDEATAEVSWAGAEAGSYFVRLTVISDAGETMDSVEVSIVECTPISEFPYTLSFPEYLQVGSEISENDACWTVVDADGDGSSWRVQNMQAVVVDESYEPSDNWLVSPAIELPEDDVISLRYSKETASYSYGEGTQYKVYVSTQGPNLSDFDLDEPLYTNSSVSWNTSSSNHSLEDYMGQTVWIAFRQHNTGESAGLLLSNVRLSGLEPPTVYITVYPSYLIDVTTQVVIRAEAQNATSLEWKIDHQVISETGNTFTHVFSTPGEHLIEVTATNAAGSTSASYSLEVSAVGIDEAAAEALQVYPNPASSVLNIDVQDLNRVEVIDVNGRVVMAQDNDPLLQVSTLANGVYYLKVYADSKVLLTKFVKK